MIDLPYFIVIGVNEYVKIKNCTYINEAAELVGFNKLMWGSDYPRTMTAITYKMSLDFIEKTNEISEEHERLILGENARAFYNFTKLPQPREIRNMVED